MKKAAIFLNLLFVSLLAYSQNFDVDELIKMRNMSKTEIDSYLNSNNSKWSYGGYEKDKHFWILETGIKRNNIMITLYLSLEDESKNGIDIMTGDTKINQSILSQIQKYGMKKTNSATQDTEDGKILVEEYQGIKYVIRMLKVHNNNGETITKTYLAKR